MSVVVLRARPRDVLAADVTLELDCRGRYWLAIPRTGDSVELGDEITARVAQRRFRTNGDVELELRSDLTHAELERLGFRPGGQR